VSCRLHADGPHRRRILSPQIHASHCRLRGSRDGSGVSLRVIRTAVPPGGAELWRGSWAGHRAGPRDVQSDAGTLLQATSGICGDGSAGGRWRRHRAILRTVQGGRGVSTGSQLLLQDTGQEKIPAGWWAALVRCGWLLIERWSRKLPGMSKGKVNRFK